MWGVHGAGWAPQTSHFSNSYRCITFDNRGLGSSSSADQGFTVESLARDAIAIMDASGVERAHVVGHSLGGLIALQLALLIKNRVRSLSLICSFANGRRVAPLTWRMIWLGMRTQIGTRAMRQRGFLRLIHAPGAAIESADMSRMQELFDMIFRRKTASGELAVARDAEDRLDRAMSELAGIPTLVLSARVMIPSLLRSGQVYFRWHCWCTFGSCRRCLAWTAYHSCGLNQSVPGRAPA